MTTRYSRLWRDGLWENNPVFGQLLALCPLLAVTGTATNGLGMGLATLAVLLPANLLVSATRHLLAREVRIPVFVLLIAGLVTLVDLLMNAYVHDLHKVLGLFIPLIVTNCAILGRAEVFASRNALAPATVDGLAMGLGMTLAMVLLGAFRELLGSGTLFADAALMLGPGLAWLEVTVVPDYDGFLLALLPPGGFMALGLLLALHRLPARLLAARAERRAASRSVTAPADPGLTRT